MPKIEFQNTTLKYKDTVALNSIDVKIEENKIVGLLGRNGAGKTSMLSLLASFRKPTRGTVLIDGKNPYENPEIMEKVFMLWSNQVLFDGETVESTLKFCRDLRPGFDMEYAEKLVASFDLPLKKKASKLSQGMKSSLNVICGLAARAPITIFDETYLGMDAPNRKLFYKELLKDYMEHPRTVIISTHYIQEVESLFEDVIIIDRGNIRLADSAEKLKERAVTVIGNAESVDNLTAKYEVVNLQTLGKTKSAVIYGQLDEGDISQLKAEGFLIEKPTLQDIFIYLTEPGYLHLSTEKNNTLANEDDHMISTDDYTTSKDDHLISNDDFTTNMGDHKTNKGGDENVEQ